jgi:hypothetical protein
MFAGVQDAVENSEGALADLFMHLFVNPEGSDDFAPFNVAIAACMAASMLKPLMIEASQTGRVC